MRCPKCNTENKEGRKFCSKCGSKLENVCPKCGYKNDPNDTFCGECGAELGVTRKAITTEVVIPKLEDMHSQLQSLIPDILAQKYLSAEQQIAGDNRTITALFADISGFTPLSATQSSEYIFQLVQECFKQLVNIVAGYEGSISGFRGDGLLALFGAPILHENDAERAILAAIDMRKMMEDKQLGVSIGINTAMMTVGEIQTQLHNEYTAYGTDINLAKRLQEAAKAGQIMVGSGTHRLTRRAFDYEELLSLELKGFTQPITAYLMEKPKPHPEKLRGIEGLRARMVGRDREFEDLLDSTESWLDGKGQIVTIIGEAGIGKSRLVSELKTYLESSDTQTPDTQPLIIEGRCISIGQPISYWPFLDILRSWFNLEEGDTESEVTGKVKKQIESLLPDRVDDMLPFLGHLMNLKFGGDIDEQLKHYSPEQIQHGIMTRLRDIFEALSQRNRLMLILEDLHWADELSLDLISLLMDELMAHPIMLVCVYRPEQVHNVYRLSNTAQRKCLDRYRKIELTKLSSGESRRLVSELLAIDNLPDSVRDMILSKSEGNPFFIEEVIRSLMERGLVYKANDKWIADDNIIAVQVPDTIQSIVLERVDRLEAEAKYILQCASVIGRLFKYNLLEHITQKQKELDRYLDEFERRDLAYPERTVPEMEYAFKHALTQEATYQGILEQRKMAFHRNVALGIEKLYKERIEDFYEELAHHWERSKDKEKTLEYLVKVGQKASKNYLNDTAVEYYTRAIELAKELGLSGDRLAEIYNYRGNLYNNIMFHEESISDLMDALSLYTNPPKRASVCALLSKIHYLCIFDIEESVFYARKALSEVDPMSKSRETAEVYKNTVLVFLDAVDPEEGESCLRKAISISEEMGYKDMIAWSYAVLYLYANVFGKRLRLNYEESQSAREKALSYLPYIKSNLPEYAHACFCFGFAVEGDERYYFWQEAIEAGIRSEATWIVVRTTELLGPIYVSKGKIHKAIEVYEPAWKLGTRKRYIFSWFLSQIAERLIDLYMLNNEHRKILDMMWQMIDSTRILHGKSKVYPKLLRRWNDQVERIYKKLWDTAPQVYHDLENALESRLKETDNDGEVFFYLGQLMLLSVISKRKDQAETYVKELIRLKSGAGSFADRISGKLRIFIEILKVGTDQCLISFRELFKSVDSLDEFQDACVWANLMLSTELTREIIDWTQFNHIALAHIKKQTNVAQFWFVEIQRISNIYGGIDNLRSLAKDIEQTIPDALKKEGITQLLLEFMGNMELYEPDFLDSFAGDSLSPDWEWVDPAGDGSYILLKSGIEISVIAEHDLWGNLDGPRLIREASGDFIIETYITNGLRGKKYGGLFVWKDKDNFIRFDTPETPMWENTIYYGANVNGNFIHPGVHPYDLDKAWLRLERKGDRFTGYVSSDGENWYRCGWTDIPMEDPIKVGIHALCPASPTTSTRFEYFKIHRINKE